MEERQGYRKKATDKVQRHDTNAVTVIARLSGRRGLLCEYDGISVDVPSEWAEMYRC